MTFFQTCPALILAAVLLTGCGGDQSVLSPFSENARTVNILSNVLFIGGFLILAVVIVLAGLAVFGSAHLRRRLAGENTVVVGGLVFPLVTLTPLLLYGYALLGAGPAPLDGQRPLEVTVIGEQWWWRVIYTDSAGNSIRSANELRIPVGRPVKLSLKTADVIHSFWVPNLAGKVDMIPGRTNTLTLSADSPGIFRGQCAEYCGGAHALMAFKVVALPAKEFATWLEVEQSPAREPQSQVESEGLELFLANGCGGCHSVRGTPARGTVGPDLTHVGGRKTLAAGVLPNTAESIARWIRDNQEIKPENRMLPYRSLEPAELSAISSYLAGLR
ncbi:MAG: cytochrome C oxidase subunit II [Alphaproteobacteria bacterium BRH_c36]|nr:MAG: cytochrome C oxidase subunit II [Alphaproteobacteria bacterium BRH_c36]